MERANDKKMQEEQLLQNMEKAHRALIRLEGRKGRPLRSCVVTFGCQMNARDSEKLRGILDTVGFVDTDKEEEADFILYNTCTVRENADQHVYGRLGILTGLKKKNPELIVGLCGCMMQEEHVVKKIRKSYPVVELIFGTHNLFTFPELLARILTEKRRVIELWEGTDRIVEHLPVKRKYPFKSGVNIMFGCNNFCSYCIVPYVRGRERSREAADILEEVRSLASDGVKEIMLLGQNVNSYGKAGKAQARGMNSAASGTALLETRMTFREAGTAVPEAGASGTAISEAGASGTTISEAGASGRTVSEADPRYPAFPELLREVARVPGIERVRFMTSHPKDLSDELIKVIAEEPAICRHIHLPVQSGSTKILAKMNRHYTREDYLELVRKIRAGIPDISLTTDIIVGFPGETEEDFEETLSLVEAVGYDSAFTFLYSKRSGTPAASWENQVPDDVAHARFERLLETVRIGAEKACARFEGRVMDVLVEEENKEPGFVSGRISQNLMVHFRGDPSLIGKMVPVRLTECKGFYYFGEQEG